jgi:uncharacterized protein DUF6328
VEPRERDEPAEGIPEQTINRNWTELVQELRSTQTGVQVLTGFLLAVPFSDRFENLDRVQRTAYLFVLCGAVAATAAVLSPVAYHRILFRRGRRPWLVQTANQVARAGLVLVALTTCGVVFLTFDLAVGRTAGVVASVVAFIAYVLLWVVVPLRARPLTSSAPGDGR